MRFNELLAKKRIDCGISQKAMAEALGVAQSTYCLYEKGSREPNISKITQIAKVLDVSLDELFGVTPPVDVLTEMISKLDSLDKAELKGAVKQMLKSEKYKG